MGKAWGRVRIVWSQIGDKCPQVAVVDSDQGGSSFSGRGRDFRGRKFQSTIPCEFAGVEIQVAQVAVVQAFGDQQDAVGTGSASLDHLIAVDDEIFPQHRDLDGRRTALR